MPDLLKHFLFLTKLTMLMFKKSIGQKPRENLRRLFWSLSQSIEGDRISREGALDVHESRERRDKLVPKFSPEKQKKCNFGLIFPHFLAGTLSVVHESRERRDRLF